jgi:hypothetical protein
VINYEVFEYKIRFYGRSQSGDEKDKMAEIVLAGKSDHELGSLIGRIFFWPAEIASTRQDRLDERGRLEGNMSVTEINAVIDMLRFEKPVYIIWDVRNSRMLVQTEQEPVGEEES